MINPIEGLIIAEDMTIKIEVMNATRAKLTVRDLLTGQQEEKELTTDQLGATMMLLIAGDECTSAHEMYQLAEPLFKDSPQSCRPIP